MKQLLTIIFFLIGTFTYAQNISVTDFRLDEMDLTANQHGTTVLDQNGEKCALIKVKTTQIGFSFDAGSLGVSKTLQKTAEIWVYVPHGVRKLSVSHQKFGSLEYALPVTTQKAKTYIMELKAETPLPKDKQRLTIKCTPVNAVVTIDGEMIDLTNGMCEHTLKLGAHKYQAMANGYYPIEGTVVLKANSPGKLVVELDAKEDENKTVSIDNHKNTVTQGNSVTNNNNGNKGNSDNPERAERIIKLFTDMYGVELGKTTMNEVEEKFGKKQKKGKNHQMVRLNDDTEFIDCHDNGIVNQVTFNPKEMRMGWAISGITKESSYIEWDEWLVNQGYESEEYAPYFGKQAMIVQNDSPYSLIFMFDGKRNQKDTLFSIILTKEK